MQDEEFAASIAAISEVLPRAGSATGGGWNDDVDEAKAALEGIALERETLVAALSGTQHVRDQYKWQASMPYFGLDELREMHRVFRFSMHYVGPVALSDDATRQWRAHKNWIDRLAALIAEMEEWQQEEVA